MRAIWSLYRPRFATVIVYMLQSTEYRVVNYLRWLWRTTDFNKVMRRRQLVYSRPAVLLLRALRLGMLLQLAIGAYLEYRAVKSGLKSEMILAAIFLLSTTIVWAHLIVLPLAAGRWLIIKPYYWREIRKSKRIFKKHPGAKIAIAGSYGKTTTKEILAAVLGAGQKVAATPANRNVAISHAQFAKNLTGEEEILIIEYGEGAPGDIARFAKATHPNIGIITGLAPAHLDKYKSLDAAGRDIASLSDYIEDGEIYASGDSQYLKPYLKPSFIIYNSKKVDGWKISKVMTDLDGLSFTMKKGKNTLNLRSQLIGKHLVAPIALAAYLAFESGMDKSQIENAVAELKPFEHRMQPYKIGGATVIDDTYNGNIDGMKAGLELLSHLPAKRKIYITPGLVDQGPEELDVHLALGRAIAAAKPDKVVLMENSVTPIIQQGLRDYKGEIIIEDDPLNFYMHLDRFVADGDLVLMQNDWPDNYQ